MSSFSKDIAVALLHDSPTNPRLNITDESIADLVDSVREHGVLQPLLCRPTPGAIPPTYELVAGHRRLHAARAAGIESVPVLIKPLTDIQVRETQLTENSQRLDVLPIEEAIAMRNCLDAGDYGEGKAAIAALATRLAKSPSFVYQRLQLLKLSPESKAELLNGTITPGHAVEIARLPEATQSKAITMLAYETDWNGDRLRHVSGSAKLSVRELREQLNKSHTVDLGKVRWDLSDANLLPEAGSCLSCPKRDDENPNRCLDTDCNKAKRLVFEERLIDQMIALHPDAWLVGRSKMCEHPKYRGIKESGVDFTTYGSNKQPAIVVQSCDLDAVGRVDFVTPTKCDSDAEKALKSEERRKSAIERDYIESLRSTAVKFLVNEPLENYLRQILLVYINTFSLGNFQSRMKVLGLPEAKDFPIGYKPKERIRARAILDELSVTAMMGILAVWNISESYSTDALKALAQELSIDDQLIRWEAEAKHPRPSEKGKPGKTTHLRDAEAGAS